MILTIEGMRKYYEHKWDTCVVNKLDKACVAASVEKLLSHRAAYASVGDTPGIDVPWYFIAVIHMMESNCNFGTHLHNGDSLKTRTMHVPPGRPKSGMPPFSWEFSAKDALKYEGFCGKTWTLAEVLFRLEQYNGWGYQKRDLESPYLWSCSNHYIAGKFIEEKDANGKFKGVYHPEVVSKQIGAAVLLKHMDSGGMIAIPR